MAIQKTEAFVLKRIPFRSSSLLVTTFSRDFGKVKGIAKGVRKEGAPFPSAYEPFTLVEIVFYEKLRSELHLFSDETILESYGSLRRNLRALAAAYYLCDLVDHLTESQDPHSSIFDLLKFAFEFLPSLDPEFVTRFFEIRLLHETGFLPHVEACVGCGTQEAERFWFSTRQGAIFCPRCRPQAPEARILSVQALVTMRCFIQVRLGDLGRAAPGEKVNREIRDLVERFLADRVGKALPSRRFLRQVDSLTSLFKVS